MVKLEKKLLQLVKKDNSVADDTKVSNSELCKGGDYDYYTRKCKATTEDKAEWDEYVKAFSEELEDFLKDDDIKQSDYFYENDYNKFKTLGSKDVAEKYIDYAYKEAISKAGSDDADCVRDYLIRDVLSSNKLSISTISLLLLFAILL